METRTAPQWIRDREKSYERKRKLWMGLTAIMLLVYLGLAFSGFPRYSAWRQFAAPVWLAGVLVLWLNEPVTRYGAAANFLNAAIVRYEVSADRPESTLVDADRRAREMVRAERIRTAPEWIREKRRRYRTGILAWFSPVALAYVLIAAADLSRWRWHRLSPAIMALAAFVLLWLGIAMVRKWKPMRALRILSNAIGRYEYESAATESDLQEADQRASEALAGR